MGNAGASISEHLRGRLLLLTTLDTFNQWLYFPSFISPQPLVFFIAYCVSHSGHLKSRGIVGGYLNGMHLPLYSVVTIDRRPVICAALYCGLQVLHNTYQCLSMRQCHFLQMIAFCLHLVSGLAISEMSFVSLEKQHEFCIFPTEQGYNMLLSTKCQYKRPLCLCHSFKICQ